MKSIGIAKQKVNVALERRYQESLSRAGKMDESFHVLINEMREFISRGGKRIRPYLAYISYQGFGGKREDIIIEAGASLEQLHNFLLIHDDIIDRDIVRYGGANVEGVYLKKLQALNARDPEHGAMSTALLAGDITATMARQGLYALDIDSETKLRVLEAFDEAVFTVGYGEFADSLAGTLSHTSLRVDQIESIYIHKTALYSFFLPLEVGAILAGMGEDVVERLRNFSLPLGIAFQMRDDYLGLFGDAEVTGKPITSDVREGKQTIYFAHLKERLSLSELEDLQQHYGNPNADEQAVMKVRELFRGSGVVKEVGETIDRLREQALTVLQDLPMTEDAKQELRELVDYCTKRDE